MSENLTRTLQSVMEEYMEANTKVRSEGTRRLYRITLGHFSRYLGREAVLSDLNDKTLVGYSRYREKEGASPNTISPECCKLSAVWTWAAKQGWLTQFPTVGKQAGKPITPIAWSKKEVAAILATARKATGTICGLPVSDFLYCFLLMCWETAERSGAIHEIKWSDIDFENRWILFRGETRKGAGAADNRQRISRCLVKALLKLQSLSSHEKVFGHICRGTVYYHLKIINRAAGLPDDRRSKFHRMRRSHATHLYVAGGDATVSLGHSSDYITRKCYLDPRFIRQTFGADLLQSWLSRLVNRLKTAIGL